MLYYILTRDPLHSSTRGADKTWSNKVTETVATEDEQEHKTSRLKYRRYRCRGVNERWWSKSIWLTAVEKTAEEAFAFLAFLDVGEGWR